MPFTCTIDAKSLEFNIEIMTSSMSAGMTQAAIFKKIGRPDLTYSTFQDIWHSLPGSARIVFS